MKMVSMLYISLLSNTKTNRCESAEALVRLKDTKSFGFISQVFIPVAERPLSNQ